MENMVFRKFKKAMNMVALKKSLVVVVTLLALSACKDNRSSSPDKVTDEDISTLNEEIDQDVERIMVDEKTGVEYILIENDGGITPRIDENGKPVINHQWLKKHQEKELQKKVNRELQKYTVHN